LLKWDKKLFGNSLYLGSILVKNQDIPFFEEMFGLLDYDWLVKITKDRKYAITEPVVNRYVNGNNLSLDPEYRKKDFYMIMLHVDGDLDAMKRLCGTRGRYYYYIGNTKMARWYFRQSKLSWKIVLYYLTSLIEPLRKLIVKKFGVFG